MTEPESNGTSQNLTIRQQKALAALLHGATVTDAAKSVGVRRETVHVWLLQPGFLQEYKAGCEKLRIELEGSLAIRAVEAIAVVKKALDDGDVKSALAILRLVNRDRSEVDLKLERTDQELDALIQQTIDELRAGRTRIVESA